MKPITKVVSEWTEAYFGNSDIEISDDGDRATYRFVSVEKGDFEYRGFVEVYEDVPRIMVFHYSPCKVPLQYRPLVAELLVLINYNLANGAIGMDMDDGEIRYKIGINIQDGIISVAMINDMVDRGTSIMDQYLPAIAAVVYAGQMPSQAYQKALDGPDEADKKIAAPEGGPVRSWDTFSGNAPVRAWVENLRVALSSSGEMASWEMAGRAAVIINRDKSYCRELLKRVAADLNFQFICIATADVLDMPPPAGLSSATPALVYLEPGRWSRGKGDNDESEKKTESIRQFQIRLSDYLKRFDPAKPIIYVTSVNKLDVMAPRLLKVGNFERFLSAPDESLEVIGESFLKKIGKESCSPALIQSVRKIGKLLQSEVSEAGQIDLVALCLRRLSSRENKLLEFIDLVHVVSHRLQEESLPPEQNETVIRQIAVHEAGHAVAAALDSDGKNIPEYTSIVPSVIFNGIVVESYAFHCAHDEMNTYKEFCHSIRICLAGRAAEEVIFGPHGISSGCATDLETASRNASKAFAYWGFVPGMDKAARSGANLAAIFGAPSNSEMQHIETLTREFLEQEYELVKSLLEANRALLDAVVSRLMSNPILDQQELETMVADHVQLLH